MNAPATGETGERECPWSSTVAGIAGAYPCKLPMDHEGEHDCTPEVLAALLSERLILRAELRTQAQLHHSCGPHAPSFVTFEECKRDSCVRARAALGDKQ